MSEIKIGAAIVNAFNLKKAKNIYRAIDHTLRVSLLQAIAESPGNKITVTELYIQLHLEQSVASRHLAVLRSANLATTERDGKFIYYSVNFEMITFLDEHAKQLLFEASRKKQVSR